MQIEDQMGHTIHLPTPPRRIISLVPSQSELLFDLGLDDEIVGVTTFCVHPHDKCESKTVVGGTKQFYFERIDELQPDLIIGNKEENYEKGIERLREKYPVWMSDVVTLAEAYAMIESVGAMVRRPEAAADLVLRIREGLENLPSWPRLRVAYLIWRKPYMAAGHRTFIHEMLHKANFVNVFGHL
ncbi:MAG: helical backbone metal receptor, partial [Candidatus Promineifilaceae bacterium]|nr:helical backbone metal receptor [Candidatus Promineifilaceae bacterium]